MEYELYINVDGACIGSAGVIGIGGIIKSSKREILHMYCFSRCEATYNEAQYLAVIEALQYIINMRIDPKAILIQTNSHLLVTEAVFKNNILWDNLKNLIDRINELKERLNCIIDFLWIPEKNNFFAKALAYKAINMPIALIENNDILPWEEDLNYAVKEEDIISLPEINLQTKYQISYLNNSNDINATELISLMTNGIDKYSRAKTDDILKYVAIRFGNSTKEYLIKVLGDLNRTYSKNVLRWTARGLKPNIAFRKAAIELEIKENA